MRTGILGGTFNPPHLGHLHAAELAHRALNLDRVLFIPTNIPPHKALPENTASAEDRCEMVRRLTAEKTWAMLDTIEIDRGGASYTLAVCARENEDWDALREKAAALKDSLGATVELVQGDSLTISSTELRQGGALRCYTPESVADYIEEKHLYGY